tara:strand:- start:3250 stop:4401 length:1152 start_codon:yes stop_codon:yes gene_type:complete
MSDNLRITSLKLNNYRNHEFLKVEPEKDIIMISGKNGSGKTNILESISLFDSNSGFRNSRLKDLIRYDLNGPTEMFGVNLSLQNRDEYHELGIGIQSKNFIFNKIASINCKKDKNNNFKNLISTFWILPEMSHMFQGSSKSRRNFLDSMILSINSSYKNTLFRYKKYKNERLKILKQKSIQRDNEWLDIIEKKMSETGVIICDSRRVFLNELNKCFKKIDDQIPLLFLKLNGIIDSALESNTAIYAEELLLNNLKINREVDSVSGRTNFSADKYDLLVYDKNSEKEARFFSTGEQKIIIISIIFSYLNIIEKKKESKVLFLLDDIFSYLDARFIKQIINKLHELKLQTWVTDVRTDLKEAIQNLESIAHNINIDDYRFKVVNN